MSFVQIKAKIVTLMEELSGTDSAKPLSSVFGYIEVDGVDFPAAFVTMEGENSVQRVDTQTNEYVATFIIRAVFAAKNNSAHEDRRASLLEAIYDKFNEEANAETLGGLCYKLDIVSSNIDASETEPFMGVSVALTAYITKPLT